MRLARREATRSDRRTPALRSGAFAAVAVFLLGMLVSFAAPGAAQEPPANGVKVFSRSQNGSCKAFEVSRKSHRMPIQSVRIKQSFDVVDAACSVSIAHGSVENLKIVLSSYNSNSFEGLGRETRRIVLKDFDKRSEVGGQNMTRAVFADEGEDLVMGEEQAPYTGAWRPKTSFAEFVKGWGKRSSIGGSRGMWTLEVEALSSTSKREVTMFSEELPDLLSWTLYLCAEGESLRSTPVVGDMLRRAERRREEGRLKAPLVRAFAGSEMESAASTVVAGTPPLTRAARAAMGWMVGAWAWRVATMAMTAARAAAAGVGGSYRGPSVAGVSGHLPGHQKTIAEHFDGDAHND